MRFSLCLEVMCGFGWLSVLSLNLGGFAVLLFCDNGMV